MNTNYFAPPIARHNFNSIRPSPENSLSPSKYLDSFSKLQPSQFLSNPKSEYEDRQALLQKAYNEELRKSYRTRLEKVEGPKSVMSRQDSRNQPNRNNQNLYNSIKAGNGSLSPEYATFKDLYYSPQTSKKDPNFFTKNKDIGAIYSPWIEDYAKREQDQIKKKDLWLQSLNQQIAEKKLEQERKDAENSEKAKREEARIRRELQELELQFKKELVAESGIQIDQPEYNDESVNQISKIVQIDEKKLERPREKVFKYQKSEKSKKLDQISRKKIIKLDDQTKLAELRNDFNEMIKDLRFEAQASKFEKDEILRELDGMRNLMHDRKSYEEFGAHGLLRAGKSVLTRYKPFDFPVHRTSMNIY